MSLVEKKAALMIKEAELDGQKLFDAVSELENDEELSEIKAERIW